MPWNPGMDSSLTLRRIFKEDSARLKKVKKEYTDLLYGVYWPEDMQRIKYLKDSMDRFRDRISRSLYELSARQVLKTEVRSNLESTVKMSRPEYNHPSWPSPRARLVAIKLGLDHKYEDGIKIKIKRLTHVQALEILARKARKTIPEFLEMPIKDAWAALGSFRVSYGGGNIPCNPLYRR